MLTGLLVDLEKNPAHRWRLFLKISRARVNKSNWPKLKESLNTIDWPTTFCGTPANLYIDVAINTINEKCTMFVPQKQSKTVRFLGFTMKERSL